MEYTSYPNSCFSEKMEIRQEEMKEDKRAREAKLKKLNEELQKYGNYLHLCNLMKRHINIQGERKLWVIVCYKTLPTLFDFILFPSCYGQLHIAGASHKRCR